MAVDKWGGASLHRIKGIHNFSVLPQRLERQVLVFQKRVLYKIQHVSKDTLTA